MPPTALRSPADDAGAIASTARRAGALYFAFLILGLVDLHGFGQFFVSGDAAATARNILAGQAGFRLGIMTDIVTLLFFIPLLVTLYQLFRRVDRWQAIAMVILVVVGITIGIGNVLNKIAPLIVLSGAGYLSVFAKPQLDALALAFLELNSRGNTLDAVFWGLWLFPFGILVIRSGFLPRVLGILLIVAGFGYVVSSVTTLALPAYGDAVSRVMMPLLFGEFPIIFWLLIKGARVPVSAA